MTAEQLEQANKLKAKIALIEEMDKEVERFKKQRFTGSMPISINRFIVGNSDLAMKVVEMVLAEGLSQRRILQTQLGAL